MARALSGEEVVLTRGRSRTPTVKLVPVANALAGDRPIGIFKHQIDIGTEFFDELPEEELSLWENDPP